MRTVEERNEDGCIGVANVNNDISGDIYTRLPMVLSGLRWLDEKYSSALPQDINAANYYFYIVHPRYYVTKKVYILYVWKSV